MKAREHLAHLTTYDALFDAVFPGVLESLTADPSLSPGRHDLGGGGTDGSPPPHPARGSHAGSPPPRHLRLVEDNGTA